MEPRNKGAMRGALRIGSISLPILLALILLAVVAPAGRAQSAAESSPEAQSAIVSQRAAVEAERAAARAAAREERAAARLARREAKAAERTPSEKLLKARSLERTNGVLVIGCTSVTWTFREFPKLPGNTVVEKLKVDHVSTTKTFTFDGATGTDVTPIDAPPGKYIIDGRAQWRKASANGANGGFDIHAKVTCPPRPDMSVEKLQRIEGSDGAYTSARQTGEVGRTIGYEIVVSNPGNVAMTIGGLTDPRCDAGTISGGPAGGVLVPATTSAYVCKHLLTAADLAVGSYSNTVMLTGTPPAGDGPPKTKTSNTVVTEVKPPTAPPTEEEKEQEKTPTTTGYGSTPAGGTPGTTATADHGKGGVLAFTSGTAPSLKGPRGCVRASFHASVRSAGVASVVFYLDGRKLRKLTAHSAHGGLLSITVNASKLRPGAHRLQAKITMMKATVAAKAVQTSRAITIVRCRAHAATPRFTA
jgi:hypothetical protein